MFRYHPRFFVLCALFACCVFGLPATADVKMVTQMETSGTAATNGESVVYIKGLKMRTEQEVSGRQMVSILDLESQQMINLNMKKKRAEVFDMSGVGEQVEQFVDASTVSVSLEPTGATQNIAGAVCNVHDMMVKVEVEIAPGSGMGATMVMDGTACLVPDAPGAEDYQRFYAAMAEKGLFLGDPRAAQGPGAGQQKGMTELYRKMAEKGVAYHSDMNVGFDGSGMMAKMLGNLSFDSKTTVKSVSTDPLSDSLFVVPSGWKVKNVN
ncbi:MAG: hypothetical protein MPN21_09845 [Thermoanaerobaculia bacterium]|nr:hypothetical protein [Thermoanaerobaculia bacterium]